MGGEPFTVDTAGGLVTAQVAQDGRMVTVEMGRVSFDSREIPVAGPPREVLNETLLAGATELRYCAATLGNPHCVVLREQVSAEEAQRLGPLIERDARFPRRSNVQFMQVIDRSQVRIEIWERGAGYTLASGSSSCAAAAVAHRLGLCDAERDRVDARRRAGSRHCPRLERDPARAGRPESGKAPYSKRRLTHEFIDDRSLGRS